MRIGFGFLLDLLRMEGLFWLIFERSLELLRAVFSLHRKSLPESKAKEENKRGRTKKV